MKTIFFSTYIFALSFFIKNENTLQKIVPPVKVGKIVFSTQPAGTQEAVIKKDFTSHDHIYGRIELDGGTIKDVFNIIESNDSYPCLETEVILMRDGIEVGSATQTFMLLKDGALNHTYFDFDILPDPAHATTVFSAGNDFRGGLGYGLLSGIILNRRPAERTYTVLVKVFNRTKNGYGDDNPSEKWPSVEEEFTFNFFEKDVATIVADREKVVDVIKESAFRYSKLPDIFSKSAAISDPKATPAKILAILKRDLNERTILKVAIQNNGGTLWSIANNDLGIPKYRYFTPTVYVAYKMDGRCYVGTVSLRETYSGGGTYGPLQVGYTSASQQRDKGIDCIKIK